MAQRVQNFDVEVEQQTDSFRAQPKVREQLRLVDPLKLLHGLQLYDDLVFDNQVGPVASIQMHTLVLDGQQNLLSNRDAPESEFVAKATMIGGLEQAGTECATNVYRRTDHLFGQLSVQQLAALAGQAARMGSIHRPLRLSVAIRGGRLCNDRQTPATLHLRLVPQW